MLLLLFYFSFILDLSDPIDIYSEWVDAINERENSNKSSKKKIAKA
jgi:transcription elongation factor Elf1